MVRGWFNYHAVPGNSDCLNQFRTQVEQCLWRRVLMEPQPKGALLDVDADESFDSPLASHRPNPASVSATAVDRQLPKVRAVWSNTSRTGSGAPSVSRTCLGKNVSPRWNVVAEELHQFRLLTNHRGFQRQVV